MARRPNISSSLTRRQALPPGREPSQHDVGQAIIALTRRGDLVWEWDHVGHVAMARLGPLTLRLDGGGHDLLITTDQGQRVTRYGEWVCSRLMPHLKGARRRFRLGAGGLDTSMPQSLAQLPPGERNELLAWVCSLTDKAIADAPAAFVTPPVFAPPQSDLPGSGLPPGEHTHAHQHLPSTLASTLPRLIELTLAGDVAWNVSGIDTWQAERSGIRLVFDSSTLLALDDQGRMIAGLYDPRNFAALVRAIKQVGGSSDADLAELLGRFIDG